MRKLAARFLRPLRRHDLCRQSARGREEAAGRQASGRTSSREAKSKVAETLEEFRGNHRYNFLDDNLRRFNAEVPMLAQWDDHDVLDNWYWERRLDADPRYQREERRRAGRPTPSARFASTCRCRAKPRRRRCGSYRRFSFGPRLDLFRLDMRSFRGANGANRQAVAGTRHGLPRRRAVDWLKRRAARPRRRPGRSSPPTCRSGLVVYDDWRSKTGSEAVANGDDGPPARPRARDRRPARLHQARGDPQRALDHGRRALRRDPPLRSQPGGLSPTSRRSTSSSPARSAPAASARTSSTTPSVPRSSSRRCRPPAAPTSRRSKGSCHFGHVKIDGAQRWHDGHPSRRRRRRPACARV